MEPVQFILIDGLRLAYREVNPDAVYSLIYFHGNSGSSLLWQHQLEAQELKRFRMIAIDLPGHGDSAAASNPDAMYNVISMGRIAAAAATELVGDRPYILAGLSLGTNIIGEMLGSGAMPAGIILVSPTTVGSGILPSDLVTESVSALVLYQDDVTDHEIVLYAQETMYLQDHEVQVKVIGDYLRVNKGFRPSLKNSIPRQLYTDEVKAIRDTSIPVLCVVGAEDRVTDPKLMQRVKMKYWQDTIFEIRKAGHLVPLDAPQQLTELIAAYSSAIFTDTRA